MVLYKVVTSLSRAQKQLVFLLLDVTMVPLALVLAIGLGGSPGSFEDLAWLSVLLSGIAACASMATGLPRIKLNAYESRGIFRTAVFATATGLGGVLISRVSGDPVAPRVFVAFVMAYLILAVSWRMILRHVLIAIYRKGQDRLRVIVYGAGRTGQQLAAALHTDDTIDIVTFVDDNPALQGLVVAGLKVLTPDEMMFLVSRQRIDRVVLAMPSTSASAQLRIAARLRPTGIEVHSLPSFTDLISGGGANLLEVAQPVEALLGRAHLGAELPHTSESYAGQTILVTGAGGSIGGELCRQLLTCAPRRLILLDHCELALYTIHRELQADPRNVDIVPVLGSVTDDRLVAHVLRTHDVQVILHAAAYKHVPLVEENEIAGLSNNVFGTRVMANAALRAGVGRFILVSSDKAVRPCNVMGASKRLAEMVVQDLSTRAAHTRFAMVRFGNVLGSSGSVIPLFREQIAKGGPITLTHEQVSRYFMTKCEAARLVLLAGSYARGGDLFVLDMGTPVPIRTLARQMIEGAGLSVRDADRPDGDIEIRITGLRPGEKLHEELLISADMLPTPHPKILRVQENVLSEIQIANALRTLQDAIDAHDAAAARKALARWVEKPASAAQVAIRA